MDSTWVHTITAQEQELGVVEDMRLISIQLPEAYIEGLEKLVETGIYPNRSEAIRHAIRDLLKRELWGESGPRRPIQTGYFQKKSK